MAQPTLSDRATFISNLPLTLPSAGEECFCGDSYSTSLSLMPDSWLAANHPEEAQHRAVRVLPCRHVVGKPCLIRWLQEAHRCPPCREPLYQPEEPLRDWTSDEYEAAALQAEEDDERATLLAQMRDCDVFVSIRDAWNREQMLRDWNALAAAYRASPRDEDEVTYLETRIVVMSKARLYRWEHTNDLRIIRDDFRAWSAGNVRPCAPIPESQRATIDGEAIEKALWHFFNARFKTAMWQWAEAVTIGLRSKCESILHPVALRLVEEAIEVMHERHRRSISVGAMRRQMRRYLEQFVKDNVPDGMGTLIGDLVEVVVVSLVGCKGEMCVVDGLESEGEPDIRWVGFGGSE